MTALFYVAAALTLTATALAITRANPVYAILSFVVSLLGMATIFFVLGAPFAAAIEVIVYAGAIMVLFLFVVMMLRLDRAAVSREKSWMVWSFWVVPVLLVVCMGGELAIVLRHVSGAGLPTRVIAPAELGLRLFSTDLGAVELASMLLLTGLIAAYHLGRPPEQRRD